MFLTNFLYRLLVSEVVACHLYTTENFKYEIKVIDNILVNITLNNNLDKKKLKIINITSLIKQFLQL